MSPAGKDTRHVGRCQTGHPVTEEVGMSDLIGKTLGPYRSIAQIGADGMATVYKACQPNRDRYLTIKIPPPYLSQDEQFAQALAKDPVHSFVRCPAGALAVFSLRADLA